MKPGREIRAYNTPGKIIKNKNNNNDFKVSNNLPFRLLLFSHCCRAIILLTVSTNVKSIFQGKRKKKSDKTFNSPLSARNCTEGRFARTAFCHKIFPSPSLPSPSFPFPLLLPPRILPLPP